MSENTNIEWTDHTFNPWWGCQKVGPGCDHCYAYALDKRTGGTHFGPGAERRRTSAKNWNDPKRWNAKAAAFFAEHGRRQRVFCASMADVFDNEVDPMWRADLFQLISDTPDLDWLLLTKRIGNAKKMLPVWYEDPDAWPHGNGVAHGNVWIGATIVNQEEADRDIPKLLDVPAAKRFLSMEPLLGPVDLTSIDVMGGDGVIFPLKGTTDCVDDEGSPADDIPALDWIIVGGESGHHARPMHPDWARSLREQCEAACVPFLFKQWGEWAPWSCTMGGFVPEVHGTGTGPWPYGKGHFADWVKPIPDRQGCGHHFEPFFNIFQIPGGQTVAARIGKKAAGRLLDGATWDEVPL